jgi:hypothetical protein
MMCTLQHFLDMSKDVQDHILKLNDTNLWLFKKVIVKKPPEENYYFKCQNSISFVLYNTILENIYKSN